MHLRRALLLFAIVLGLAAIVASVSRTDRGSREPSRRLATPPPPPRGPSGAAQPVLVRFAAGERGTVRRLAVGRPAVVSVTAGGAGLVSIPGLGLSHPAEPGTPARFDVFEKEPGRFEVVFFPAGRERQERVGTLVLRR